MTLQSKSSNSSNLASPNNSLDGAFFLEPSSLGSEALFAIVSEKVENIFNYQRENTTPILVWTESIRERIEWQETTDEPKSKFEVLADARRDVQLLLAELKYKAGRTEILLGTKQEQAAFLSRIETCLMDPGIFTRRDALKSMFETIITDELANGMSRAKNFGSVLEFGWIERTGDAVFNYPAIDRNSTLIPMDIHLAFEPRHTVHEVFERLDKQYKNRFNAITLINTSRIPLGLITASELGKHAKDTLLQDVSIHYHGPFWTLETPSKEIEDNMYELGVNIFPITDTKTETLIGYITHETVTLQETRVYLPRLQAEVREKNLKDEIQGGSNVLPV